METQNRRSLVRTAGILHEGIRRILLDEVYDTIQNWRGPLPTHVDLLRICPAEQIEFFLSQVIIDQGGNEEARKRFIQFVVATEYKNEPGIAPNGEYQQVLRTTPIHLAFRVQINDWDMVRLLFRIYDRFDLNYVDDKGLTHFHVAFYLANLYLVRAYLNNGQDPNMTIGDYSLLRWALRRNDTEMAKDLVSKGADPTRVDEDGSTALHIFCKRHENLVKVFFRRVRNSGRNVQINEKDRRSGDTPLHLAARHCVPQTIERLLRLGGNPNLPDGDGCTALHLICKRERPYKALRKFFETCDAIGRQVDVNATNNDGRTPLNLLYLNPGNHVMTWQLMQNRGARL